MAERLVVICGVIRQSFKSFIATDHVPGGAGALQMVLELIHDCNMC